MQTEKKNIVPFTITPKKMEYLGIHLPKYVQGLYAKNYKMLMKEIKENLNKCKDILCS